MMTSMLRRAALLMVLFAMSSFSVWADEVTAADALQKAQDFATSHFARKGGAPKSKPASQIKAIGQVSGLYVFGLSDAGGFVIVSNDDCTIPILGYSDSGTIDPNNMPDNMRSWLQGYAEEIAWLRANGINEPPQANRTNRTAKAEVSPLMKTKWNQDSPYNDLCPVYDANGSRSAAGCVATAYAQVMYYTETVTHNNTTTTTTVDIPGYTTSTKKIVMPAIPAGTVINWSAMTDEYDKNSTSEAKTAVANLMLCCGCAVNMNYNRESGANTQSVVTALTNYFGYATTTQYVNRSCYTYDNWINLIYHELSNGRPVVYGGESTDRGHEFVCDGYQYDDGDRFHINWGWGGACDGYFLLSLLNPKNQGIGGSSSDSAFTLGQEAVIGIQKKGDEGTVYDAPTTAPNSLTINSITLSHSTIAQGESVKVRVNVTNNSDVKVYDGEIYLSGVSGLNVGDMFVIPAGETRDCDITFTPNKAQSYTLKACYYADASTSPVSSCSASLEVKNQTPKGIASSSVASESATISWNNVGDATKWNLRSMPVSMETYDFSRFVSYWTLDGWTTDETAGVNDSPCIKSSTTGDYHWFISSKINFGGSFSFYSWKSDDEKDEDFAVLYSTNRKNFYYLLIESATTTPTKYTVDLSDLSGEGYVAIIHYGGQTGKYLYVDDVTIIEPAGDWTMVKNLTANSYDITGLTATPRYVVQVQAVNNDGGKWSESYLLNTTKNTLTLQNNDSEAATKNADLIKQWNGVTANVTLSGRTFYKDGDWNTICLPFDVTLAGSDLAGAEARELSSTVVYNEKTTGLENGVLTLNFSNPLDKLLAGKPYIIKWSKDTEHPTINNPEFNGVILQRCYEDFESNGVRFLGFEFWQDFKNDDKSILFMGTENKLYWPMTGASLGAFRAYFELDPNAHVREFNLGFGEEEITGILSMYNEQCTMNNSADAAWYTLDGRKLESKPTAKGLYIYKGIKRVVK